MKEIILAKYGEIILKGGNRPKFENILMNNIRNSLKNVAEVKARLAQATIYVEVFDEDKMDIVVERLSKIFGIVSITRAVVCEKAIEDIKAKAKEYLKKDFKDGVKFKVEAKRSDKQFPLNSPQICMEVGGYLDDEYPNIVVDVHNPEVTVKVEVRDFGAYVYADENKVQGQGGMPIGTGSKATLLLSGGIDSPVAGHMISKRGVEIDAVNFFSFPYTSERAKQKVVDLAKIVAKYAGPINLHVVNFTDIQLAIYEKCPHEELTIIMRRYMMKIAEHFANEGGSLALITGESIGQVASQTIHNLAITNEVCNMPVFRPCIGMDKQEIVDIAEKIGTFETSIQPFEDCCTIFVAKHPVTKGNLKRIKKSEEHLEDVIDDLMKEAIDSTEIIHVK